MTLTSKSLKVGGRNITVRQATYLDSIQRAVLMAEASKEAGSYPSDLASQMYHYTQTFLFPSLMACTEVKKPWSLPEFLQLKDQEVEAWVKLAQEINPHWFITPSAEKNE